MRVEVKKRGSCRGRYRVQSTYLSANEWHLFDLDDEELAEIERQGAVDIRDAPLPDEPEGESSEDGAGGEVSLDDLTIAELRVIASENGIDIPANTRKDDIIDAIRNAEGATE